MINLGRYNRLYISRFVDFGAYLTDGEGNEVLLPARYLSPDSTVGDEVEVFVYNDSEERPVAVTDRPFAQIGEFAFLQVADINRYGAFLDWGVPKQILVPFAEQRVRMKQGGVYPVYVYLDHVTNRIVASAKLEKFLGNVMPDYRPGQAVKALVWQHTNLGYKVIADNLFQGMIFDNDVYAPLEIGQTITAYIKSIRDDCKLDLTLSDRADRRIGELAEHIAARLKDCGGVLPLSDSSSPELIKAEFQCSKKDFKKAVGKLYKDHLITIGTDSIKLAE